MASGVQTADSFTALQGQYLAYIRAYSVVHRRAPSEAALREFFEVTVVHQVILTLERKGLTSRTPGQARSLRLLVPTASLPELEERPRSSVEGDSR